VNAYKLLQIIKANSLTLLWPGQDQCAIVLLFENALSGTKYLSHLQDTVSLVIMLIKQQSTLFLFMAVLND
jgi:hypothetical protein